MPLHEEHYNVYCPYLPRSMCQSWGVDQGSKSGAEHCSYHWEDGAVFAPSNYILKTQVTGGGQEVPTYFFVSK